MPHQTWNIGVLMLPYFQFLDMAGPIDLIGNISLQTIQAYNLPLPPHIVDNAPIVNFYYISSTMDPVKATTGPMLAPTHTYDTCPQLDWLLVPGPDPQLKLTDKDKDFIRNTYESPALKGLMMICTGGFVILHEGGKLDKKVKWVGDKRFNVDRGGRVPVWSSAGITAGMDLAYAWMEAQGVDRELLEMSKITAEFEAKMDVPDKFESILEGVDYK
ncbi:hypothetical protein CVT24_012839 [Panaeolus cyanescens]|uniref:DJ-1/PfpI domain-containing protein n=1 Tax=Panaeolus cyanescens TaxID=181874 RepID=A0A409W6H8_9AGAR|nr:hypothetical protein CVT24_012839 [Panaeolus cyanescens]